MGLDSAVAKVLGISARDATVSSAGRGGCSSASTSKILVHLQDGSKKAFFMKTGKGIEAGVMFEGEHASLTALYSVVPSLCPYSFGHGRLALQPDTSFLVTEFLHLTSRSSARSTTAESLAAKLAKLHTTPAPIPPGHQKPVFGFPVTTCCGDTPQKNTYNQSWADFYAENRLLFILQRAEARIGEDKDLHKLVEKTAFRVVPRLIGDKHLNGGKGVKPVVVNGDLWSGNTGVGVIDQHQSEPEDITFDSSACYAHNEYDLGIMGMFGGFYNGFMEKIPRDVPQDRTSRGVRRSS